MSKSTNFQTKMLLVFIIGTALVAAIMTVNLSQISMAQVPGTRTGVTSTAASVATAPPGGSGFIKVLSCGFAGTVFQAGVTFKATGTPNSLTGSFSTFNPNGIQSTNGHIASGVLFRNTFVLQGHIFANQGCGSGDNFVVTGPCGANVPIWFAASKTTLDVTGYYHGTVNCSP